MLLSLSNFINEKLVIGKNVKSQYREPKFFPENRAELINLLKERFENLGPGTEKEPIDLNDIDVSNIDDFSGVFYWVNAPDRKIVFMDVTNWNVENATTFYNMFGNCKYLRHAGDLSCWRPNRITNMKNMFKDCKQLRSIGNIGIWNIENVTDLTSVFQNCEKLEPIDLNSWTPSLKLTGENINLMIAGTSGWKMPTWYRKVRARK